MTMVDNDIDNGLASRAAETAAVQAELPTPCDMAERRDRRNKNYTYTTPVTMVDNDFDNDLQ